MKNLNLGRHLIRSPQKAILSIIAISLLMLSVFLYQKSRPPHPTDWSRLRHESAVKFFSIAPGFTPSVNPAHSDIIRNSILMEQLTGTLIKERLGNTGESEPYLAKSWNTSADNRVWTFTLHQNLKAEDGTVIDAAAFSASLHRRLRTLLELGSVPAFEDLTGWKAFALGQSDRIEGLSTPDAFTLRFQFDSAPDGLLQFLAMPGFGFFAPANFDEQGNWRSNDKIISSGAYRLRAPISSGAAEIEMRADWPLSRPEAPRSVEYRFLDWPEAVKRLDEKTLIVSRPTPIEQSGPWKPRVIRGAPIFLGALTLSSKKLGPFQSLDQRKTFRAQLYANTEVGINDLTFIKKTRTFYPRPEPQLIDAPSALNVSPHPKRPVLIYNSDISDLLPEYRFILDAVTKTANDLGFDLKVVADDKTTKDWFERKLSGKYYDIRFSNVDIGGAPENWVIKMMFCSRLGVSFQDPSGRICEMTKKYSGLAGHLPSQKYLDELDAIISEDSAVIPIYHTGYIWHIGSRIDATPFNSTTVVPRIEQLRVLD